MLISTLIAQRGLKKSLSLVRKFCSIKDQTVKVNGQSCSYIKIGQGEKVLFLLPGTICTKWTDFAPQIRDLDREKFTIIAWDPPGVGQSRPPEREWELTSFRHDADVGYSFMQQLGIKKFSMVGFCGGGMTAMVLAAKYPHVIDKLVLVSTLACFSEKEIRNIRALRDIDTWSESLIGPYMKAHTKEYLSHIWHSTVDGYFKKVTNANVCMEYVDKIKCPTIIFHGGQDPLVLPDSQKYLTSKIKGSKLYEYPKASHHLQIKYAEEFNKIVTDFLE